MPNQAKFFFQDEDGKEGSMTQWTDAVLPSALAALVTKLRLCTNARLARYGILLLGTPDPAVPVGTGPYDIADKAVFESLDGDGNTYKFVVPAPRTVIFTDSDNIDLNHIDVQTLQTAVISTVRTRGGATIGPFVRGYRTRSPRRV